MRERDSSHSLDPTSFFVCVDKHSKCKQSFVDTTKLVENWQSSSLNMQYCAKGWDGDGDWNLRVR